MAPKKAAGAGKGKAKATNPKVSQDKVSKARPRRAKAASPAAPEPDLPRFRPRRGKAATPKDNPAAQVQARKTAAIKSTTAKAKTTKATTSKAPATKAKARKAKAPKQNKYVRKGDFTNRNNVQFVLTTTAEVKDYQEYDLCKRLVATFKLKQGKQRQVEAGYLVAWIVDKTLTDPDDGSLLWMVEFLTQADLGERDKTSELRRIVNLLYLKNGNPRKAQALKNHQEDLAAEKLIFMDTLLLNDEHRRTGLAQRVINDFHSIVRDDLGASLIVLSPAKGEGSNWCNLTVIQVERCLIRLYEGNSYALWVRGKVDGGVSIMSQVLEEDEDEDDE